MRPGNEEEEEDGLVTEQRASEKRRASAVVGEWSTERNWAPAENPISYFSLVSHSFQNFNFEIELHSRFLFGSKVAVLVA